VPDRWEAWKPFTRSLDYTSFPPGSRVLDVGCGNGWLLGDLRAAGCIPIGIETNAKLVAALRAQGYDVRHGVAEELPIDAATVDGVVCRVVVPYTDERRAISEWGRVLRPGGRVRASYHGMGYYMRYALLGESMQQRAYGARSLVSTWYYAMTGRRLPGWMGNTLYQTRRRLGRYYREAGLRVTEESISASFLYRPVYIYHVLERL
jgi:SAM-dependent methyltransferase